MCVTGQDSEDEAEVMEGLSGHGKEPGHFPKESEVPQKGSPKLGSEMFRLSHPNDCCGESGLGTIRLEVSRQVGSYVIIQIKLVEAFTLGLEYRDSCKNC
jgi:hypothetical protein